jgi:hypothetical protein
MVPRHPDSIDELEIQSEDGGRKRMLFAPLGNSPAAPRLAVVGITPGGQVERFSRLLRTHDVTTSARLAAFSGAETAITQLLEAHGFLHSLGIAYSGSINDCPDVFTTSLVKCCMTVNGSYKYKAPDIDASEMATRCVTRRFITDIEGYNTLSHVAIFGAPGWDALKTIRVEGKSVLERLRARGLIVLNFPHFAQNYQQRAIFRLEPLQDEAFLRRNPKYRPYYSGATEMRSAVLSEIKRIHFLSSGAQELGQK